MAAPKVGARIGAIPITIIILEKACAEPCTSKRSRIAARAITTPTQPPKACKTRAAINDQ